MWFFGKRKIDRLLDVKELEKKRDEEEPLKLEKGDLPAMLIAALIVFGPVVLGAMAIITLLAALFGAFR